MSENGADQAHIARSSTARRRHTKQDRSRNRQRTIAEGAIAAISDHGIAGLTHRRVAEYAQVSLAATTYYYQTKNDIITDASHELLDQYVRAFRRFEERYAASSGGLSFRDFALKLVANALGRHRAVTLAWCEITLNAAHEPELQALTRSWYRALVGIWQNIARLLGEDDVERAARSAIDVVVGFLFLLVPLGLSATDARRLLLNGSAAFAPDAALMGGPPPPGRTSKKAEATRERILRAAVEILMSGPKEPLTFRTVAERSGLTIPAPTYHFSSMSTLLNAAQMRLFAEAKTRYRLARGSIDYEAVDVDRAIDLTATVFLREATEYRDLSLAAYPVYIQSSREPRLRPGLWSINAEQWQGWSRLMHSLHRSSTPFDAWVMAALFTGKLIRVITTGATADELAATRDEFAYDLRTLVAGRHWTSAR